MAGEFSDVLRLFHDETAVRQHAIDALQGLVPHHFSASREVQYDIFVRFDDHDDFVKRFIAMGYNHYSPDAVRAAPVARAFENGRTEAGNYCFVQPMRVNVFFADADPKSSG